MDAERADGSAARPYVGAVSAQEPGLSPDPRAV